MITDFWKIQNSVTEIPWKCIQHSGCMKEKVTCAGFDPVTPWERVQYATTQLTRLGMCKYWLTLFKKGITTTRFVQLETKATYGNTGNFLLIIQHLQRAHVCIPVRITPFQSWYTDEPTAPTLHTGGPPHIGRPQCLINTFEAPYM
jgi:hypothetical protein